MPKDSLMKLAELIGVSTEGMTPLIDSDAIPVNRDLIRAFVRETLDPKEGHTVAHLIATYTPWYDAHGEIIEELAMIEIKGKTQK